VAKDTNIDTQKFDCCYELSHKGIYMEVDLNSTHVAFSMYNRARFETQVCINSKDDARRLIELLEEYCQRS